MRREQREAGKIMIFWQRLPLPTAALALALAAIGNFAAWLRPLCAMSALFLWSLVLIKYTLLPQSLRQDLQDDVLAGVWPTFLMAGMNLAVYAQSYLGWKVSSKLFWLAMLGLHLAWVVVLTIRLLKKRQWQSLSPALMVTYVGVAVGAITAPAFGEQRSGLFLVYGGLIAAGLCAVLLLRQRLHHPVTAEGRRPLVCIYAAPISLCLAGYLQCAEAPQLFWVGLALTAALLCYAAVLPVLPGLMRLPFYPSKAAMTFPMVISALAAKQSTAFLQCAGYGSSLLTLLVILQEVIAIALTLYVLAAFITYLAKAVS